jgi:hypothetical protein
VSVDALARAIAAWEVPGSIWRERRPMVVPPDEWAQLVDTVRDERLEGPLTAIIGGGGLQVSDAQYDEAERIHVEAMGLAVRIDDLVRIIARDFADAGLQLRLLKGAATARLDHPDPALRSYGDADLLVATREYDAACKVLCAAGFERRSPEFTPGFDRRFAKSVTFVSRDGLEVDLHRTIVYGPFSVGIPETELWCPGPVMDIGGTPVEALEINRRFVHACIHTAVGSREPRLTSLRDVAVIGAGSIDPDQIVSIATRWRIEPVIARAASLVRTHLGVELDWLSHLQTRPQDFRMRCSLDERAPWASATIGLLVTLPSWSDRAALARMLSTSLRTYGERSVTTRVRSFARASWRNAAPPVFARSREELALG